MLIKIRDLKGEPDMVVAELTIKDMKDSPLSIVSRELFLEIEEEEFDLEKDLQEVGELCCRIGILFGLFKAGLSTTIRVKHSK